MTSDRSNYHKEDWPDSSCSIFQFERSEVISVLKSSIEYSFVFFKCLLHGSLRSNNVAFSFGPITL